MASKAPDYDAMADDTETDLALGDDEAAEAESDLDAELLLHAKEAGLTDAQAAAMKLFVERCTELKDENAYLGPDEAGDTGEEDEEAAE
jgi:hypothetical protein